MDKSQCDAEGKITSQNGVRDRDFFAIFWDFLDYFWDFFWIFGIFGIFLGDFWDLLDFFSEKCTGFFSSDFPLAFFYLALHVCCAMFTN